METHAVDLTIGPGCLWTNLSDANRRAIRKAERSGLEVAVANAIDDYRSYYECYQDSLRRWGDRATSHYPLELLLNMAEAAGDKAKLWLARHEGRVVSGSLVLYHGQHAVYWHGASREESLHMRPSNLVHWQAIRDAHARGFRWFDFNPSGGHDGVARYKTTFGPTVMRFERGTRVSDRAMVSCYRWMRDLHRRLLG
jgi:lipid II:glycine glycyltransferase (peptidoglycan interpeptide bridge formation enzyme)